MRESIASHQPSFEGEFSIAKIISCKLIRSSRGSDQNFRICQNVLAEFQEMEFTLYDMDPDTSGR